jgi:dTDP-4-dehydrorhamnose reductase
VRILVTGGNGLLGSTLVPFLRSSGHEVIVAARSVGDVRVDLTDTKRTREAVQSIRPAVIVNLAGETNVDACQREPQRAYLGNVRIVETLVDAIDASASFLIHLSTDQLYDGNGPHAETALQFLNYYALSKYAGELAAARVPSTVLRTNFVGRSRNQDRQSLSDWIVAALRRGDPLKVFRDVFFSPLSLTTLAAMIDVAVNRREIGVFNLGSTAGMSKADFAFELADELALPTATMQRASVEEVPLAANRPTDMRMDSSRFERRFGVSLPTLSQEIRMIAAEYRG